MKKNGRLRLAIFLAMLTLMVGSFAVGSVEAQALIWIQASNPSAGSDQALDVAVHSSGVYVVGLDSVAGNQRWRIEKRSLLTGSLLWAVVSNPSGGNDVAYGVAVDSSGVYVVGYDMVAGNARWRIEKRSHANGATLWTQVSNPSTGADVALDVAVSPAGLYVVGYDMVGGAGRWRVEKRNPTTGALSYFAWWNLAGNDVAEAVAIDATGVYVVGSDSASGNAQWRIEKRNSANLALMWTQVSNPSSGNDKAYGVAVRSEGLYVVGFDAVGGNQRWRIERRSQTTGALLAAPAASNPSSGNHVAYDIAAGATGVYVVGYDMAGGNSRWRIEKRSNINLALIWSYAINPSAGDDRIWGVGIDQTGIYTTGYDMAAGNFRWIMEKRMPSAV